MTMQKSFKRLVRSRMEKTGESYTAARRSLLAATELTATPGPALTVYQGLGFETRDADADHARLLAQGVEADAEVMRMGEYVPPMFTFRDADGNRFRMVQRD